MVEMNDSTFSGDTSILKKFKFNKIGLFIGDQCNFLTIIS